MSRPQNIGGFLKWFAVGFLLVFGSLTSIGLAFLLLGVVLFIWFFWRGPRWPADLGLLAGAGAVCLLIAAINAISGDLSPYVWAAVGVALLAAGTGPFWWIQDQPGSRQT